MVDTIAGHRLEALVGRGSAGTVWLARREGQVDQVVAVKRIPPADPDAVRALRREAEILASLDHPHVVALLDLIDDPPGLPDTAIIETSRKIATAAQMARQ